jgi:hypothetical protein
MIAVVSVPSHSPPPDHSTEAVKAENRTSGQTLFSTSQHVTSGLNALRIEKIDSVRWNEISLHLGRVKMPRNDRELKVV